MARPIVIIPALNESDSIGAVVDDVATHAPDCNVVVIDDGSQDETGDVASAHGAKVITHPYRLGYGVALQTGYRYALENGYDLLVQIDGDGQHRADSIPALVAPIEAGEADVVLGGRFFPGSRYRMPVLRRLGSVWFALLVRVLTGWRIRDPTSGLQALARPAFEFYGTDCFPNDYPDADMLVLLNRNGFRVVEVPVTMISEAGSPSMHSGIRVLYYVYKMTLSIVMNAMRAPLLDRKRRAQLRVDKHDE